VSDNDDETPVTFRGRTFCGIRELGFNARGAFIVALWTTPPPHPRGGYMTSLAISPTEWRRRNPKALSRCGVIDAGGEIVVLDDWGEPHPIKAPRPVLDRLRRECAANDIPLLPQAEGER